MKNSSFRRLARFLNYYPPYLGAGIRIKEHSPNFDRFVVQMKMRWYNKNIYGTHFGGSLYAMCDPFFVFIMIANLGEEFIVWDKAANIHFKKPGKGTMTAIFEVSEEKIEEIRADFKAKEKATYWFKAEVKDENNQLIAEVEKEIYIRRKGDNS